MAASVKKRFFSSRLGENGWEPVTDGQWNGRQLGVAA